MSDTIDSNNDGAYRARFLRRELVATYAQAASRLANEYGSESNIQATFQLSPPRQRQWAGDDLRWLCLWGEADQLSMFWRKLERESDNIRNAIVKCDRVIQPTGEIRFDIWTRARNYNRVCVLLSKSLHSWRWHVRDHIPYMERFRLGMIGQHRRRQGTLTSATTGLDLRNYVGRNIHWTGHVRMGTYNINGFRNKSVELRHFLETTDIDVLAVQETLLGHNEWRMTIRGYHCFESPGSTGPSRRGVAIVIKRSLSGVICSNSTSWHVIVRITGPSLTQPILIGSVYVPHGPDRNEMFQHLTRDVARLTNQYPNDPIFLMGDWNMTAEAGLLRIRDGLGSPSWSAVRTIQERTHPHWGRPLGRDERGQRCRNIDHIFTNGRIPERLLAFQLSTWDLSDHNPIQLLIDIDRERASTNTGNNEGAARLRKRIRVSRDIEIHEAVKTSNYWECLADEELEADYGMDNPIHPAIVEDHQRRMDRLATKWEDTAHKLAEEHNLYAEAYRGKKLSRQLRRIIDRRRHKFRQLQDTPVGDPEYETRRRQYIEARRTSQILVRKDTRERWRKIVLANTIALRHDPRTFWNWASRTAGWKRRQDVSGVQPMQNERGEIVNDLASIAEVWSRHYRTLLNDNTGHSRDPEYWRNLELGQSHPTLHDLNKEFDYYEVQNALCEIKRHKAPGPDGVPADFLKLGRGGLMGDKIEKFLNLVWRTGTIPDSWSDSVLVPIFKKGDPTDPQNYRGISLMNTLLKLIMIIISKRINKIFEEKELFSPFQSGFRRLEECMTQFAAVYETVLRRKIAKKSTYLLFVDFKKAYDMVPHECLFAKLEHYGVRGRTLRFIKELYRKSTVSVRCGSGHEASLSEPMLLGRGLRQGCPLSPVLFNIFINDIFDGAESYGVRVPAGLASKKMVIEDKAPGSLFADDVLGICPSRTQLHNLCRHITVWSRLNEMEVGISKCGVMVVNGSMARLREHTFHLMGQPVPVVEEYTYLGMVITPTLDKGILLGRRFAQARSTVNSLGAFLRCPVVPMYARLRVLQTVVLPRLLYGAEIYGMNRQLTDKMQCFLNQALRRLAGLSPKSTVSNVALWREFGVRPICALAAARRARAYQKCRNLRTWASALTIHPYRARKWTWMSGTVRWLRRYLPRLHPSETLQETDAWWDLTPKGLKNATQGAVALREETLGIRRSKTAKRYTEADFDKKRVVSLRMACPAAFSVGLSYLVQCRVNGVWWGRRLAHAGLIHERYRSVCPCCQQQSPETMEHALLECSRWDAYRVNIGGLIQLALALASTALREDGDPHPVRCSAVDILLGGKVRGRDLGGWLPARTTGSEIPEERVPDNVEDSDSAEEDLDVTGHALSYTGDCGGLRVATFLSLMIRARAPIIRGLRRPSGWSESPASTSDQSPNG